eukprot:GHVR01070911.1.p1 GENE.GHVR01070911.1~~GHVR01070911.1.p1  ORF type:complete len:141 (-),score=10.54 GHVR01070911.1:37-459(-)
MKPMTYHQKITKQSCANLRPVRGFLHDHGRALAETAHKLGGSAASARVFLLCEAMCHTRRLTRAQSSQLVDFHRLLTLERVSDPDRIESGLFAQINPASAFVGECCLLSEKLDALLRLIAENEPVSDILCEASQKISQVA